MTGWTQLPKYATFLTEVHVRVFTDSETDRDYTVILNRTGSTEVPKSVDMMITVSEAYLRKSAANTKALEDLLTEIKKDRKMLKRASYRFYLKASKDYLSTEIAVSELAKGSKMKTPDRSTSRKFTKTLLTRKNFLIVRENLLNEFKIGAKRCVLLPDNRGAQQVQKGRYFNLRNSVLPHSFKKMGKQKTLMEKVIASKKLKAEISKTLEKRFVEKKEVGNIEKLWSNDDDLVSAISHNVDAWSFNRHEILCYLIARSFNLDFARSDVKVSRMFGIPSSKTPDLLLSKTDNIIHLLEVAVSNKSASKRFTEKRKEHEGMIKMLSKKGFEVVFDILVVDLGKENIVTTSSFEAKLNTDKRDRKAKHRQEGPQNRDLLLHQEGEGPGREDEEDEC